MKTKQDKTKPLFLILQRIKGKDLLNHVVSRSATLQGVQQEGSKASLSPVLSSITSKLTDNDCAARGWGRKCTKDWPQATCQGLLHLRHSNCNRPCDTFFPGEHKRHSKHPTPAQCGPPALLERQADRFPGRGDLRKKARERLGALPSSPGKNADTPLSFCLWGLGTQEALVQMARCLLRVAQSAEPASPEQISLEGM